MMPGCKSECELEHLLKENILYWVCVPKTEFEWVPCQLQSFSVLRVSEAETPSLTLPFVEQFPQISRLPT